MDRKIIKPIRLHSCRTAVGDSQSPAEIDKRLRREEDGSQDFGEE